MIKYRASVKNNLNGTLRSLRCYLQCEQRVSLASNALTSVVKRMAYTYSDFL